MSLVSTVLPARQGQIVVVVGPDTLMDAEAAQPFIMIRLLAAVGIAALAAYVTDIEVPLLPVAIAQMDGRTQVATLGEGVLQRQFRVYRPNRISRSPGLVIVLHGSQGTGLGAETLTGFDAQAHRLGWIAVYPDGYSDGWDGLLAHSL